MAKNPVFIPAMRILLESKRFALVRFMTSCMRGCCHCPGVDTAGDDCCCFGVLGPCGVDDVLLFCGVRVLATVLAEGIRWMREVEVDMIAVLCCAV